jgi:hypothetical protein
MKIVFMLRNVIVGAAALWALFSILFVLTQEGNPVLAQFSIVFWHVMMATLVSLGAVALAEICLYVTGRRA